MTSDGILKLKMGIDAAWEDGNSRPPGSRGISRPYNPAIQDSRMTFGFFVESKFIPEHVQHKTVAGQTHYQAMLKHVLRPETVNRVFNPRKIEKARLASVPDWPYLDGVRLCDIKTDHVRRLLAAAASKKYSWQTLKHIKNVVFAIVAHAQREGCFSGVNPAARLKLPPKERRTLPNLTIVQTRAILELLQSPERDIAILAVSTGMTVQEICALTWKNVNLSDRAQYVDGEIIPARSIAVRGRFNPEGLGDSKRGRNRNIAVPTPLFSRLADLNRDSAPDSFVVATEGGLPISNTQIHTARLAPIARKLGIPWLSWRALSRAHTGLLSEFRSEVNRVLADAAQSKPLLSQPGPSVASELELTESGTIGPKSSCGSFCAGNRWRNRLTT